IKLITQIICECQILTEFLAELRKISFQIQLWQMCVWPISVRQLIFQHDLLHYGWKSAIRLSEVTFKKRNHGLRERKLSATAQHVFRGEVVGHHVLSHISHHFRAWCYFDNSSKQLVYFCITLLDLRDPVTQTMVIGLLSEI